MALRHAVEAGNAGCHLRFRFKRRAWCLGVMVVGVWIVLNIGEVGVNSRRHVYDGGIIQLGLLILIATPVARVAFSVVAFALERDRLYVVVTLIVLAVLVFSLAGGHL